VVCESIQILPRPIDFNKLQHNGLVFNNLESVAFSVTSAKSIYQVRDQEAGGSNPLAPTILFSTAYTLGLSEKVVGS
jgi:hypothetical protein